MTCREVGAAALVAVPLSLLLASTAGAQQLYGGSPFRNNFYMINPDTAEMLADLAVTVPGHAVTGINAVTIDPTTGTMYAIVQVSGTSGRLLVTLDPPTAIGVEIGNLGDKFASLAFRGDGQLFGVTGDGATNPETLYLVNKADATKTVATVLGNGEDGEVIAYNPLDQFFYHWSGNLSVVYERIQSVPPYAVTGIPIGATSDEIFGAVWDCRNNVFLTSNVNSRLQTYTPGGTINPDGLILFDNVRGLALRLPDTSCDLIFRDGFDPIGG